MFEVIQSYLSDEGEWGVILRFFGSGALPVSVCLVSPASFSDDDHGGTDEGAIPETSRFQPTRPAHQVKTPQVECSVISLNFEQEQIDAPGAHYFCHSVIRVCTLFVCVCLFRPAGLPVLLAAPLPCRGLVEVADQGSEPGSVAEG